MHTSLLSFIYYRLLSLPWSLHVWWTYHSHCFVSAQCSKS